MFGWDCNEDRYINFGDLLQSKNELGVRKKNGKLFSIIILLENLSKFLLPLGLFWLILCLFIYLFDLFPCWLSG